MQVTLSERAAELATQAVQRGLCATVSDAIERGLEFLASGAGDLDERWTPEYADEVNRMLEEAEDDIRAGRVFVADEAFKERMRERIREVGRAAGNLA
ncbi:MAG: hypothetical protein ACKVT1_15190 [Dehalococcoidia bacterium]